MRELLIPKTKSTKATIIPDNRKYQTMFKTNISFAVFPVLFTEKVLTLQK